MSSVIDAFGGKTYTSSSVSECEQKSKNTEKKKKKQILTQREGKYYCTYMVDEKGKKFLINRIPINHIEKEEALGKSAEVDEAKHTCDYNAVKNARTAFECRQQMHKDIVHKKNVQEIMDILDNCVGIPGNSNKTNGF